MKRLIKAMVILLAIGAVTGILLMRALGSTEAPRQPIEFSHFQHVTKEEGPQIECSFCHEHADKSRYATIPNVSTCMVCHESVESDKPEVQKLAAIAERNEQPAWVRVYWFEPEANAYFTHKPHVGAGINCAECHGAVDQMARVGKVVNPTMGWCIDCHRQRSVSIDCYVCHR